MRIVVFDSRFGRNNKITFAAVESTEVIRRAALHTDYLSELVHCAFIFLQPVNTIKHNIASIIVNILFFII